MPVSFRLFRGRLTALCMAAVLCAAVLWTGQAEAANGNSSAGEVAEVRPAYHLVTLTGFTRPRRVMELVSEESARCDEVVADVGDTLGEDGLFLTLDTSFIKLDLRKIDADQARAESEAGFYAKQVSRYTDLVGGKTAAQKDLDDYNRLYNVARQEVTALQVQEAILREHLKRYEVKGPPGWRVIERFAEPGEWVRAGEQVAALGDFRTLLVPFAFTAVEYEWLSEAPGNLTLRSPALGVTVPARIERVSPDFDPQTRKLRVDLEIVGGLDPMRGGIRMELDFRAVDPSGAVLVPRRALTERYEEHFVVTPKGRRIKVVYTGGAPDGLVRVMSKELKPGDEVVLGPKL